MRYYEQAQSAIIQQHSRWESDKKMLGTYCPCKWKSLPVEDYEKEQQQPRCPAWTRQKRLDQGRPVDAPGGVAHRSHGDGDDGQRQGEPADPGGRHGPVVVSSSHPVSVSICVFFWARRVASSRAQQLEVRDAQSPKGGAGQ